MRTLPRILLALPLATLAAMTGGCSDDPSRGYTCQSLYREGICTVAVPVWHRGNNVYRRGLEDRLTEALAKRIELNTPYKVVGRATADTALEGTITAVDQRELSTDPDTGAPRDIEMRIVVSFTWTDLRTGEILVRRTNFRAAAVYYLSDPFNEDFFEGSADAINRLADRIVETMEKPW